MPATKIIASPLFYDPGFPISRQSIQGLFFRAVGAVERYRDYVWGPEKECYEYEISSRRIASGGSIHEMYGRYTENVF